MIDELKLYRGSNILLIHFNYFISLETAQHPEKRTVSFTNFFMKCEYIRSCYLPMSSISKSSNIKKKSFRKTSRFRLTVRVILKKSILLIAYFKLLLQQLCSKSLKNICEEVQFQKIIFRKSFLVYLSRILTTNSRTPFLKDSSTSCLFLVVS